MLTPGSAVRILRGDSAGSLGTVVYAWGHLGEVLVRVRRPGDPLALCAVVDVSVDLATPTGAPDPPERTPGGGACASTTRRRCAAPARGSRTFCFDPEVADVAEGVLWGAAMFGRALFHALVGRDHPFEAPPPTRRMTNAIRRHSWSCQAPAMRRRRARDLPPGLRCGGA